MKAESSTTTVATRRRSIKSFLQIPILTRSDVPRPIRSSKPVGSVPADIILEIADRLSPSDVLNFSLTSSRLHSLLLPTLYATVVLKSSRQCRMTLAALVDRPDICVLIRKLAVRPNYYLAWPKPDKHLDEGWVVEMIAKMSVNLISLHTFDWDGLEMPKDYLWSTLRNCCPLLRTVYSNVGFNALDPQSHLYDFSELTSFSLIVRHGLGGSDQHPEPEELPDRLWEMLLKRCPNLEEVTICSFSSYARLFDLEPITSGEWPKLHTLTLGSFGYQSDLSLIQPSDFSFGKFLAVHPSLLHIRLSWNFKSLTSPDTIPMQLPSDSLPSLTTYIGIYQQLAEFPNPSSIETVDLTCEPIYESRLPDISLVLSNLTSLTSLDIWICIPNPNSHYTYFFRSILMACPKLTDLHFMCTTPFSAKPLGSLSAQLYLLPQLKSFSLTKGHKYKDESMLQSALRIIHDNPTLQQINIRWAREACPNHLKQEGTYDVTSNSDGVPVKLVAYERGLRVMSRAFARQFQYDLKPRRPLAGLGLGGLGQKRVVRTFR